VSPPFAKVLKLIVSQINAGIQAADSAIVNSETKNLFQSADTWLQKKREDANAAAPVQNGDS
jgi:hypothetical protein